MAKAAIDGIGARAKNSVNDMPDTEEKTQQQLSEQSGQMNGPLTIVKLNGSNIKILLPYGYEKLKHKNPLKDAARQIKNIEAGYQKVTSSSDNRLTPPPRKLFN